MPQLSSFYGIVIYMYHKSREHNPPHIHAIYAEYSGTLAIGDGALLEGELPPRALRLVREWIILHQDELTAMWVSGVISKIDPLD